MTAAEYAISIPLISTRFDPYLETLFRLFGSARRRAYNGSTYHDLMNQGLNGRYVKDAIYSVKDLPPHVTFGGKKNQKKYESGKLSLEQWRNYRNCIVVSRGELFHKGNLNMRFNIQNETMSINTGNGEHIILPAKIPQKYLEKYAHLLGGNHPYTVILSRRGNQLKMHLSLIVPIEVKTPTCRMCVDINAGHIDWAIVKHDTLMASGRIRTHDKRKAMKKLVNIASHYNAQLTFGKLNTQHYKGCKKANRKVHNIPHSKLKKLANAELIKHSMPPVELYSEAYTTRVGSTLQHLGLDIHKCSATAFCIKCNDYEKFLKMKPKNEGNGIPMRPSIKNRRGYAAKSPWCFLRDVKPQPTSQFPARGGSFSQTIYRSMRFLCYKEIS